MKHCLYIHQDYQPPKKTPKFYMQSAIVKPCRMFYVHFSTDNI